MTNLTPHFTEEEMLRSDYATRKGITAQFEPMVGVIGNLGELCSKVLEPLREKLGGKAIHISSGYRCLQVNTGVGGQPNSQHIEGKAADTEVDGMTVEELFQFVKKAGIPFDQLIQEYDRWVHISYNPDAKQRGQCLRITKDPNDLTGRKSLTTLDCFITF